MLVYGLTNRVRPTEEQPFRRIPPFFWVIWSVPTGGAQCIHYAGLIALQGSLPGGAARLEQLEPARASCPRLSRKPQSAEYAERISSGVRVANVKQVIYVTICFAS